MDISDIKYARSGDLNIAYQRFGAGPDVVIIPGLVSNVELAWEHEVYRRAREYIGRYVRVLEFDKRGMASSDRFEQAPTLEQRIDDIKAVMDAEGIERAHVLGLSEGGLMGQLFAALHPERVDRLVLVNSTIGFSALRQPPAAGRRSPDAPAEVLDRFQRMIDGWGREPEHFVDLFAPSKNDDPAFIRWVGRFQRQTCSRADVQRQFESILGLDANDRLGGHPGADARPERDRRSGHPAGVRPLPGRAHSRGALRAVPGRGPLLLGHAELARAHGLLDRVRDRPRPGRAQRAAVRHRALHRHRRLDRPLGRGGRRGLARHARPPRPDRLAGGRPPCREAREEHGRRAPHDLRHAVGRGGLRERSWCASSGASASRVRAGLHAGEIVVREDGDVTGLAVNLAARVQQAASGGATWVSSTVRDLLLGGEWSFAERGEHALKGIDGAWRLYELAA